MRLRGPVFCGQHNSVCYQINVEGARRNVWINCLNRKFSRLVRQGYQTVSDAVDDRSSAMGLQRRRSNVRASRAKADMLLRPRDGKCHWRSFVY